MADLSALLDANPENFEAPPKLPEGEYEFIVMDHTFGESSQKKTKKVDFSLAVKQPLDSVDTDELENVKLEKAKVKATFYLTEDALFMLREFLEKAGCMGESFRESIDAAKGQTIVGTVKHRQAQGSDRTYIEVGDWAEVA